jgi:hypothetical protein
METVERLVPVNAEALLVADVDIAGHDGEVVTIAVGNVDQTLRRRETLDVTDREAKADVTLVVGFPVLHEVRNVLDVNARARDLPETRVGRLATGARVALVTRLLEELAPQARTKLADLVSLLSLIRPERSAPSADTLLARCVLLGGVSRCLLDNGLGRLRSCRGGR